MTSITVLPIEHLHRRADARALNNDALAALSESIEEIGLVNPIRVRRNGNGYEVIAGAHRYAACDLLGHRQIACIIVEDDDLHAELAMIDENLCRAELSPSERAKQTARRKALYEKLHPETRHGEFHGNQHAAGSRQLGEYQPDRFTAETATATGRSERAVQRDAERGEKVSDDAAHFIRSTELDTGAYLDRLKRLPPDEQLSAAKRDLAARRERSEQRREPVPTGRENVPVEAPPPTKTFERFIKLINEIETLPIADVIAGCGRKRAVLGQRASGVAERMSDIMERLDH